MDTRFTEDEIAFQQEVRTWFAENYTDEVKARLNSPDFRQAQIDWQKLLHKQGWVAPGWPEEYGGTGWNTTQKFIFDNERTRADAPAVIPFGLTMVAPVIYTFGTDEQKAKFLPRILESEDWWCQGYSEPGAGSDLAALKTKAELDGDDYVVNGAKIWTSYAQYADWIFCLVRTSTEGKKQQGISFLLIDMRKALFEVGCINIFEGDFILTIPLV